jgi:hypothetical protein
MWRIMVGVAAWTAGTVIAVTVAWLGASVVVRNAGAGPGMPVINAAVLPPPTVAAPTPPVTVAPAASATATAPADARRPAGAQTSARPRGAIDSTTAGATAPSARPASPSSSATSSAGDIKAYTLTGGRVTLDMTNGNVQLVTAVPAAGYSVQTWSGTGWLRVDFSSGPQVSSLIASWYEHAPAITVTN